MSKRLKAQQHFLHLLAHSKLQRRKHLLKLATKEELASLFEICLNILKGRLKLNDQNYKTLQRHKHLIRTLGNKKVPLKHKKKLVNQKGGFLGTLAAIALPLLGQLLTR